MSTTTAPAPALELLAASGQCHGLTRRGTRCSRIVPTGYRGAHYCGQHAAQGAEVAVAAAKLDALPTDEDDSPCPACGTPAAMFGPDRLGWTCSDECAELMSEPGSIPVHVTPDAHEVGTMVVVTLKSDGDLRDVLGYVHPHEDGTYSGTVEEDGAWFDGPGTLHDGVRALVRMQRDLDHEHPTNCTCGECYPIPAGDVFVAGERVRHTSGQTGTVVLGTHRDDSHVDDLYVTVAWDGDGDERYHPSTLTRVAPAVRCSGCDAPVVVTVDERGATTHCGGDGDGVCDAIVDGAPAATQSHADALAAALVSAR